MHLIEVDGVFVAGASLAEAEAMADLVRRNEPFLMARVRHLGGPERSIIAINNNEKTVTLSCDDGRPGVASGWDTVPWSECSFR